MRIGRKLQLPQDRLRHHLWYSVLAVLGWSVISLGAMNELGDRRRLQCYYPHQPEPTCDVTSKKPLGERRFISSAKVQQAVVKEQESKQSMRSKGPIYPNSYHLSLVTAEGEIWLSANDSSDRDLKLERARQINSFLRDPNSSVLTVDGGWSGTFWIVSGVFIICEIILLAEVALNIFLLRKQN